MYDIDVMNKIRNSLRELLPKNIFTRHVVILMTGTVIAAAIEIISMPILTRIYKPEDFGTFALYSSLLSILTVVACWSYDVAIVLPEKDEDAANLLLLCVIICCVMGALTLIFVVVFGSSLAYLLSSSELSVFLLFMPLSLLLNGFFRLLNFWSTRRKQFKRLAARRITQNSITALGQVGAGFLCASINANGLIGGSILGQLAATGRLAGQIFKDEGKFIRNSLKLSTLFQLLKRYKNFPIFDTWSSLLNTVSAMLPIVLLGFFFNPIIVGFYALGFRILAAPISIMGTSMAQVFFQRAAEVKRIGHLDQLTLNLFDRLLSIGFVPMMLLTLVAPDLFALVFGVEWFTAGVYLQWLSVWLLFVFISSPLSSIYSIMERQREGLIVNVIMLIARLFALVIGGIKGNAHLAIALFGVTSGLLWIFNCFYIQYLAGVAIFSILETTIKRFLSGLIYALLPLTTYFITQNSLAFVLSGIGAGLLFMIIHVYQFKNRLTEI